MFANNPSFQLAYQNVKDADAATEHYMSKCRSTLKQIVREWSKEGAEERRTCYGRVLKAIRERYPESAGRSQINVLIPGCGLGRLNYELLADGYSVCGNEYSFFMILCSNFLLNFCTQPESCTIYPYLLDFSNVWSYEYALQPVTFPDVSPVASFDNRSRPNNFSMCAGEFLSAFEDQSEVFDCVVTVFFLDTGTNPLDYMRTIYRILKPGGCWINFGPLMYHFEGDDENSLELPFSVIVEAAKHIGFKIDCVEEKEQNPPSNYTCNPNSMLKYQYNCGFIEATKPT